MGRLQGDPEKDREWQRRSARKYEEKRRERAKKRIQEARRLGMRPKVGFNRSTRIRRRAQPTTGFRLWVRETKRCAIPPCKKPYPDPHHDRARGMGRSADPWSEDEENVVPLCRTHHDQVHTEGPDAVQDAHGITFARVKIRVWEEWSSLPPETRAKWEGRAYRKNQQNDAHPSRRPR